ncbi:MAG TPA: zf-TFIIB domain-containing protein [Terriglobales bacterium]|nr:zf-TFIIB domain-containing protein [Terriglobales bacterium]
MRCLNCGAEMALTQVSMKSDQIAYEVCEKCASLWLDRGEMDKVAYQVKGSIEFSSREPTTEAHPKDWKCPRCDNADLYPVHFLDCTDIVLHRCGSCGGFWLDGGDLDRINRELAADGPVQGHGFSDFVYNTHLPLWVKRVKVEAGGEARIEAAPIAGAEKGAETSHRCPACATLLDEYRAFAIKFEGCPACKGLWLFQDELRELKGKLDHGRLRWLNDEMESLDTISASASKRICPICAGQRLVSAVFGKSKVVLDYCRQCHGTWLDRNEFEAIKEYLRHEKEEMGAGQIGHQGLEAIRRLWSGGREPKIEDLLDAKAAAAAMVNAGILEHPALARLCYGVPRI